MAEVFEAFNPDGGQQSEVGTSPLRELAAVRPPNPRIRVRRRKWPASRVPPLQEVAHQAQQLA